MSCLPQTPTGNDDRSTPANGGWVSITAVAVSPTALSKHYGIAAETLRFLSVADGTNQHVEILQIEIEETVALHASFPGTTNTKKNPLVIYLYDDAGAAPTSPSVSAAYNGSTTNLLATYEIVAADYYRVSDTVWRARVTPTLHVRTGTTATSGNMYMVILTDAAVTYAAATAIRARITTRLNSAL